MDETQQMTIPHFGGANGITFEENCEMIRKETMDAVREIGMHQNSSLDVTCTQWQEKMDK